MIVFRKRDPVVGTIQRISLSATRWRLVLISLISESSSKRLPSSSSSGSQVITCIFWRLVFSTNDRDSCGSAARGSAVDREDIQFQCGPVIWLSEVYQVIYVSWIKACTSCIASVFTSARLTAVDDPLDFSNDDQTLVVDVFHQEVLRDELPEDGPLRCSISAYRNSVDLHGVNELLQHVCFCFELRGPLWRHILADVQPAVRPRAIKP